MPGPRVTQGVRAPLFDRLSGGRTAGGPLAGGPTAGGPRDQRMLDRVGLHASIRFELDRLLNTRTPVSADDLDRRPRGTLDYGLPDLSLFWPFDTTSEAQLAGLITRTVAAFEPRLLNPHARIERVGNERRRLRVEIGGSVALNGMVEPVTFPILLSDSAGDNVEG